MQLIHLGIHNYLKLWMNDAKTLIIIHP